MLKIVLTASAMAAALTAGVQPAQASALERPTRELSEHSSMSDEEGELALRACRERASLGQAWRVYLQVDNRDGWATARARLDVKRRGAVVAGWSSGRVSQGELARVQSIRVPDRAGLRMRVVLRSSPGTAIGSGPFRLRHC